jgi:hypothetical protein
MLVSLPERFEVGTRKEPRHLYPVFPAAIRRAGAVDPNKSLSRSESSQPRQLEGGPSEIDAGDRA